MEFSMELAVPPAFLQRCLEVGHWNLRELAKAAGRSARTVSHWINGEGGILTPGNYHSLAHAMFPHDAAFAAEIATMGGTTLEALGLVKAPPAPLPPAMVHPPPELALVSRLEAATPAQADAVLCTAAERLDVSPRQLRPVLAAAFARALELGLSTAALARAFAPSADKPTAPAPTKPSAKGTG
jgi:transcriptional regulator with XRE-family HTH domain